MKILLISHYWQPFNNSGTFRWLNFGKYIKFDVLTSKKPVNSFIDKTIENTAENVYRFGKCKAVIWGFLACLFVKKYDYYIITSPPETLLFCAWILQLRGKKVLVDMRDEIDRNHQQIKALIPFYRFLYRKIKNIIVSWQFIDESKTCVYHGYELDEKVKFKGYYVNRVNHRNFIELLKLGYMPDQSNKPDGYVISSFHTFKKLGFQINFNYHKELDNIVPESIETQANKILSLITRAK